MKRLFRPWPLVAAALLLGAPYVMAQTAATPAAPSAGIAPEPGVLTSFPPVKGVKINRAAFGIFTNYGTPTASLRPTNVVRRDGSPIGWVLDISTENLTIRWREEFVVPSPPKQWGMAASPNDVRPSFVSADKMMATTERLVPTIGTISHWWKLDATDPAGHHTMRVYAEDVLIATFEFDVE